MSQDDSRELIFILHLAGSLGLEEERLTWCVRGLVPRLGDYRGAGQPERE